MWDVVLGYHTPVRPRQQLLHGESKHHQDGNWLKCFRAATAEEPGGSQQSSSEEKTKADVWVPAEQRLALTDTGKKARSL